MTSVIANGYIENVRVYERCVCCVNDRSVLCQQCGFSFTHNS